MATAQLTLPVAPRRADRHATLKDELARAFSQVGFAASDVRAFAWDGLTCIVRWQPTPNASVAVELRLRRGEQVAEHAALLPATGMIARWCEHHVLFFAHHGPATVPGPTPA